MSLESNNWIKAEFSRSTSANTIPNPWVVPGVFAPGEEKNTSKEGLKAASNRCPLKDRNTLV